MNTKNDIINQIQDALGSAGSHELAERTFDAMREDGRIDYVDDAQGLVIREGEDIIAIAAGLVMLMNPATGSVDTAGNWASEGHTPQNSGLIEVVKDESGSWVEA